MKSKYVVTCSAFFLLCISHISVNFRQPQPYMDELFHVPQAQEFCHALIHRRLPSYDPNITTPPALYIPNAVIAYITGNANACHTRWLRATSAIVAFVSLILLADLLHLLTARYNAHSEHTVPFNSDAIWLLAFIIWLHPVALFYANLYYTDTTSLFWLLLFWRVNHATNSYLSAALAMFAFLSRQTNMVWHVYIAFDTAIYRNPLPPRLTKASLSSYVSKLLFSNIGHILAACSYLAFLIWNRGIPLGDKSHHQITLHHAMFPYFVAFHGSAFTLIQLSVSSDLFRDFSLAFSAHKTVYAIINVIILSMVIATGSWVHRFVLDDNRHFTFYLYRRWLSRSSLHRLSLVPMYSWFLMNIFLERQDHREQNSTQTSGKHVKALYRRKQAEHLSDAALLLCAFLTMVPSGLLELRYFVAASTLLSLRRAARLQSKPNSRILWLVTFALIVLQLALVFIFTELPFKRPIDIHMPHDHSLGRFMF